MAGSVPILIDGSQGAGAGHLLLTALALSCVTGKPFGLVRSRKGQTTEALQSWHLGAARAAARLCEAQLSGDGEGTSRLDFTPRRPARPGDWSFDLGPSGSAPELLQSLCWPLALAGAQSTLSVAGATHRDLEPSFHQLALVWAPTMARFGFQLELGLQAAGFDPEGGGALTARVDPARPVPPFDLRHRGLLRDVEVLAMVGGVPYADAVAEADQAQAALAAFGVASQAERLILPVRGSRGRHTLLVAGFERIRSGHGATRAGERAGEGAAAQAVASFRDHLEGGGAVDRLLAEQLLLPAALRAARLVEPIPGKIPVTRFTTGLPSSRLLGTAAVIRRFLDVEVSILARRGEETEVRVQPPGAGSELLPLRAG